MELNELKQIRKKNLSQLMDKLIELTKRTEEDVNIVLFQKRTKAATRRVRNAMLDVQLLTVIIREKLAGKKGKKTALSKAIKRAENKLKKRQEKIEELKRQRMQRAKEEME